MTAEHHKISGRYYYVVTLAVEGSHELRRQDLTSDDRAAPDLLTLVQVEASDGHAAPTMYAGQRQALAGYVLSWDRPITVRTETATIVRLIFVEGHKGA